MRKVLKFISLILRHGHLKPRGQNLNRERNESLKNLQEFIPPDRLIRQTKNPGTLRNIQNQLSFMAGSLKITGGHIVADTIAYIRIPKSASTSMSKAMLEKKYPALQTKSITEKQVNFLADVNLVYSISGCRFFTIVRNPFIRLVSVYRDLFENSENFIYHDYLFGILPSDASFSEFINRITVIPDQLKDQHIRQQCDFLKYYEKKKIEVKVLKLEETEAINTFLASQNLQFLHLNKSGESYDYRSYYTPALLQKAYDLYRDDVKKFGYENAYTDLQKHLKTVHF